MTNEVAGADARPFESASELRAAHALMLDSLDQQVGDDGTAAAEAAALSRLEPMIRDLLERGVATGAYLDEVKDRTACQVLLDYWVSSLAQAALGAPSARLVPFDSGQLPDLKDKPCPYVGLDAFRGREFFFGRDADTQLLLAQVRGAPLVVVLGASGSGKSSLVMGGVLPALAESQEAAQLRVVPPIVPGTAVLAHLASAVLQVCGPGSEPEAAVAAKLETDPAYVSALLGGADAQATVVTIDQFEEIFTLASSAQRDAVVACIEGMLDAGRGHRVIVTMREEFRSRLAELRGLSRFLEGASAWYSMRPMGYDELKAAVERPAAAVNLQFQSGIVDDLVKKVLGQPAALPLLQFTLRRLWDGRDRNRITREVYDRVGDPLTALQASADQFYDFLAPQTQAEVRRILLALVRVDELLEAYRQPVPRSLLLQAGKANTEEVLAVLAANDYVRVTGEGPNATVEVKHESLIRNWPRLVTWIDEKRIERRQRIALTQAAQRWKQSSSPDEGLLTGWQLSEARKQSDLSPLEREFVEASAQQVDRVQREREEALQRETEIERRRARSSRRWAWGVGLSLSALTLGAAWLAWQAVRSERAANVALGHAGIQQGILLAESGRPDEALALLAQAIRLDPASLVARSWISDLVLNERIWVGGAPLRHADAVAMAVFSPDGRSVLTLSGDVTLELHDALTGSLRHAFAHTAAVHSAAFSADGRRIATASDDGKARVWDATSGQLVTDALTHVAPVNVAAFSPDGGRVATASGDATARVWDAATGKPVAPPMKHAGPVYSIAFSPDGRHVVTASDDGTARVWDAANGRAIGAPLTHRSAAKMVVFSPDGRRIATLSADKTVRIWDAGTGRPVGMPLAHGDQVVALSFSPNGPFIVTASANAAYVWDVDTGEPAVAILRHKDPVRSAAFSPDGSRVVTASDDGTARVWDALAGAPVGIPLRHQGAVHSAAFGPDGRHIVTASHDKTARVWELASMPSVDRHLLHEAAVAAAVFSSDGLRVLTASGDRAQVWDVGSGRPVGEALRHRGAVKAVAFSPDGRRVATSSDDNTARLWLADSGQPIGEPLQHDGAVQFVLFSPDGVRLVTTSDDRTARLWDATTGLPVGEPLLHETAVHTAVFSADGRRVITASDPSTLRVWDTTTGRPAGTPTELPHEGAYYAIFSADGSRVITASADFSARVWDVATGQPVGALLRHGAMLTAASFSADGSRLVTSAEDDTARLWEVATGEPLGAPLRHEGTVVEVGFSPDGQRVVTASLDGSARVWDASTGQPMGAPLRHQQAVNAAAFSPDGRRVVTVSDDLSARIWQVLLDLGPGQGAERLADLAEMIGGYRVVQQGSVVALDEVVDSPTPELTAAAPPQRLGRVRSIVGPGVAAFPSVEDLLRPFLSAPGLR